MSPQQIQLTEAGEEKGEEKDTYTTSIRVFGKEFPRAIYDRPALIILKHDPPRDVVVGVRAVGLSPCVASPVRDEVVVLWVTRHLADGWKVEVPLHVK